MTVVETGLGQFYTRLTGKQKPAGLIDDKVESTAIVRGAMALYGTGHRAKELVWQLKDSAVLERAIETIVNEHFEIQDWILLETE